MSFKPRARPRCQWVNLNNPDYVRYHDEEWGRPVHDDALHFEMITLEGAQAGLSWETVLNKRTTYRKAFRDFDPKVVASFSQAKAEKLMLDPGVVRNRLKIESTISNAKAFLAVQEEFGTFDNYVWGFLGTNIKRNRFKTIKAYPSKTPESDAFSKDLKKRGFRFVGSTTMYAYMQAAGFVDDHMVGCFLAK